MTRKLSSLFDLPQEPNEIPDEEPESETPQTDIITTEALSNLEKIDQALPAIRGLDAADKEMDDIAKLAIESYKDLMDLGMNVEARVASEILGSASQFLGHAITAKNAKINKKLKMLDLMMKKAKLDQDSGDPDAIVGEGKMLDRNELLAEVLRAAKEDNAKTD
jgi:hypothetical protein